MGGDHGPSVTLGGAARALRDYPELRYLIFGEEKEVAPFLERYADLAAHSSFHPCDMSVSMDEKPSQALRRTRKKSGMARAVEAVRSGEADAVISAGNTGALMAMSKIALKMMPGIERPALAASWPNMKGESIVLDVGAGIGASAEQLVDFALMGCQMSRVLYGLERPKIGLLNIGVEEMKGLENVRQAGAILKETQLPDMEYIGFVEGDHMSANPVDVIVTEGFSGNISLKTAEGTARQIATYLRESLARTAMSKLGAFLAKGAFRHLRHKMDPRRFNGAVFLGVNGLVVKSHGSTDETGFASAVSVARNTVRNRLLDRISEELSLLHRESQSEPRSEREQADKEAQEEARKRKAS